MLRTATAAFVLSALLLAGCGSDGGDDGDTSTPPYTGPTVLVSGRATYDRVPDTGTGLDYAATTTEPIRGATVEIRNAAGTRIYFRATTDHDGDYSITAPASLPLLVVVTATLGEDPAHPDTKIVDNTDGDDPVYGVYVERTTTTVNATGVDLHAASGWDGTAYGDRLAAPFAILDTIYSARLLVLGADPDIVWPDLKVGWSTQNDSALIKTSHYSPETGRISILGAADEDTDEFDDHVIAHEWGHFFESKFSRSDSLGGSHGAGNILDETVAFGEGWGNAFSAMVTRDPLYFDTMGADQASTGVSMDMEDDSISDAVRFDGPLTLKLDGGWSESSIQEICWDLFDGGDGTTDADADGIALGFTPLYDVFVGAQKNTPAFTSIYSFLDGLKTDNPSSASDIEDLVAAENIGDHDALEQTAAGFARCTVLPTDGSVVTDDVDGKPLTTSITYGPIVDDQASNRLYHRLLFRTVAPSTGSFKLRATPLDPEGDPSAVGDLVIWAPNREPVDRVYGGAETMTFNATSGQVLEFAVGSFISDERENGATPFIIRFGPAASFAPLAIPSGDG